MKSREPFLLVTFVLAASLAAAGCSALPSQEPAASENTAVTMVPAATTPPNPGRREILDAFREIAFASEYGDQSERIRKWTQPVRVEVRGDPTEEDKAALGRAINALNALDGFPGISLADSNANMTIWFVKRDEMAGHFQNYVQGNWGYFSTDSDASGIIRATVAIATDVTDQAARNHLIFEETLQPMGLMRDSDRYADSIFYGRWTKVQQPTKLDLELLRILYIPELKQGMPPSDAMKILEDTYAGPGPD